MGGLVDFVTGKSGDDAAVAAKDAAAISARGQEEALEYLKETEALPQHFRESALTRLAGLYGIDLPSAPTPAAAGQPGVAGQPQPGTASRPGAFGGGRLGGMVSRLLTEASAASGADDMVEADPYADLRGTSTGMGGFLDQVRASPLYQAILGTRKAGEEGILRSASATGGLRSGNVNEALYDQNQRLEERALLSGYEDQMRGLTGLAGIPSMAPQIAQATAAPAMTRAQGITAGAQAQQANTAGMMQGLFGLGGAGLIALCDSRLKTNVRPAGERLGLPWYKWDWNDKAKELGLTGEAEGVMAHEVAQIRPDAVGVGKTGYLLVDYEALI